MITTITFGILVVWGSCKGLEIGVRALVKGLREILNITNEVSEKPQKSEEA